MNNSTKHYGNKTPKSKQNRMSVDEDKTDL